MKSSGSWYHELYVNFYLHPSVALWAKGCTCQSSVIGPLRFFWWVWIWCCVWRLIYDINTFIVLQAVPWAARWIVFRAFLQSLHLWSCLVWYSPACIDLAPSALSWLAALCCLSLQLCHWLDFLISHSLCPPMIRTMQGFVLPWYFLILLLLLPEFLLPEVSIMYVIGWSHLPEVLTSQRKCHGRRRPCMGCTIHR